MTRLLPVPNAARHYQRSERTITNWAGKGLIKLYRTAGGLAVDLDEVDAMLARTPRTRARDGRKIGARGVIVDAGDVVLAEAPK